MIKAVQCVLSIHLTCLLKVQLCADADRLRAALPGIVGLYETKTANHLFDDLPKSQAQAKVEFLAINQMTEGNGMRSKPIVVLGDLNNHYIFEKKGEKVFMTATRPVDLAYSTAYIKSLLALRAKEAHEVLPGRLTPPGEAANVLKAANE